MNQAPWLDHLRIIIQKYKVYDPELLLTKQGIKYIQWQEGELYDSMYIMLVYMYRICV